MTQADLERAVSRATGESLATVRQLGFQLEDRSPADFDEPEGNDEVLEEGPLVFDWDDRAAIPWEQYLDAAA